MEIRVHNIDIGNKNDDLKKIYPYYYSDKRINDQHMDLLMDHNDNQIHILLQVNNEHIIKYCDWFESMELQYDYKKYNLYNNINYMIGWNKDVYDIKFLKQDFFTKTGKIIPLKLRDEKIDENKKEKLKGILYNLCLETEYERSIVWYNCYAPLIKKKEKNFIIGVLHFDKNDKFKELALKKLNEFIECMKATNIPIIIVGNFNIFNKSEIDMLKNTTHNSWIDFEKQNIKTTYCPNIFNVYNNIDINIEDNKINEEIYNILKKNSNEEELLYNKKLINPKSILYKKIIKNKDIYEKNKDIIEKFNNMYNKNNLWEKIDKLEEKIDKNNFGITNGCITYNINFKTKKLDMTKDINSNLYHSNHYPIMYSFY